MNLSSSNMVATAKLPSPGKQQATLLEHNTDSLEEDSGTSDSGSDDESSASSIDATSESDSDLDEEFGREFLDSLLEKARRNAALKARDYEDDSNNISAEAREEDEIRLETGDEEARKCVRRELSLSIYPQ